MQAGNVQHTSYVGISELQLFFMMVCGESHERRIQEPDHLVIFISDNSGVSSQRWLLEHQNVVTGGQNSQCDERVQEI